MSNVRPPLEMLAALVAVAFAPLAVAGICFLVALYYMARMLNHVRSERRGLSYLAGPAVLVAESLYTNEGVFYFRAFQRWFRRFSLWLVSWGAVALLIVVLTRISRAP